MRSVLPTALQAIATAMIGLGAAALIAMLRADTFSDEIRTTLWIVGGVILVAGLCAVSPTSSAESTRWSGGRRTAAREKHHRVNLGFVLLLGSVGVLAVAYLVNPGS